MTQIFDERESRSRNRSWKPAPVWFPRKRLWKTTATPAVQIGFRRPEAPAGFQALAGHFKKGRRPQEERVSEFRLDDISALNVGDLIKADVCRRARGRHRQEQRQGLRRRDQALELPPAEGISRFRTCCPPRRFHRRLPDPRPECGRARRWLTIWARRVTVRICRLSRWTRRIT